MPCLAATNIDVHYGERPVLDGVSLSVDDGERVGIVGRNGGGKSTLLRVLAGVLKPDGGSVAVSGGARVGYLMQDPELPEGETLRSAAEGAFAELHALHERLDAVFASMSGAQGDELERLLNEQARLEKRMEAAGGYAIGHRIDAVLHGLGFTDSQFDVPVSGLSGGQRSRLALATLLLTECSVLLLDEPTNHLDIDGRLWLERFLADEFKGAVVLISHDRYLLDRVVDRIVEVESLPGRGGRLIEYPGNYAAFREQRAVRVLTQRRAYEKQQTQFKREEAFIRKFKAGQRAKQARGRETRLERAKEEGGIEKPLELDAMRLSLPKSPRAGELVAVARGLRKAYAREDGGARVLFDELDVTIERGSRWGVIGPNGAGKTTLVRCILGEAEPDAGSVTLGTRLSIGYFSQSHAGLDPEQTVVRYLQDAVLKQVEGVRLSEQQARDLAGAFLFSGDDQEKTLGLLSGGERSRAVLAGLMATAKNVLVLDEPTNHLDIPSAERLEEALRRPPSPDELARDENAGRHTGFFEGTLILISHDRALLDACCDRLLVLDGRGGVEVFHGTYSRYREAAAGRDQRAAKSDKAAKVAASGGPTAAGRPAANAASKPKKSKWSWMKLEQIEERLGFLGEELAGIDRALDDPDVWLDLERANKLTDRRDEIRAEMDALEAEWVEKAE